MAQKPAARAQLGRGVAASLEELCQTGWYEWHAAEDRLVWSESLVRLYGLSQAPRTEQEFVQHIHPDDRTRVEAETAGILGSSRPDYSHTFRIIRPDGAIRFMLDRGVIERDDEGRVAVVRGMNVDLTDLALARGASTPAEKTAQELAELETLYAEAPLGLAVLDRDLRFVRINDALAEINGFPSQAHLGRRVWDLLPELRESAEPALLQVLKTGLPLRNVHVAGTTPAQPGVKREWREHFYPLRDNDGAARGIGIICEEVTERLAAERAVAESEARFRNLADHAPVMVWVTAPDGACTYLSSSWYEFTGQTEAEGLGFGWLDAVHPDDASEAERVFREATASQAPFRIDYRLRRHDGSYHWAIDAARPRFDSDGSFLGFVGSVIDISERKEDERRLAAAHATFRQLVDRSPFGVYAIDADFRLVQVSDGAQKVFANVRPLLGRDFAEVLRTIWAEPFASEAIGRFRHTLATGETYHAPSTVEKRADINAVESYDWKIERVTMPDGRPGVVCHFYDLSERQAHEEKVQLLMREMSHRTKNMLALIEVVARHTASSNPEEFLPRFGSRLRALAANQDLLMQADWQRLDLAALITRQLIHFKDLLGARIMLDGPSVALASQAAQALGMAIHELSTNAAKYGALANDVGRVEISWRVLETADGARLTIMWAEHGGPRVAKPSRTGFGRRVTKTMVEHAFSGRVTLDYAETGLVWELQCPLAAVSEATANDA